VRGRKSTSSSLLQRSAPGIGTTGSLREIFSFENREGINLMDINGALLQLDIARSIFAAYVGLPATRLGLYLDGARQWDPHDFAVCQKMVGEMLDLSASIGGLPLQWSKVGAIRPVLDARRAEKTWTVETSDGRFCSLDQQYRPVFDAVGVALTGEGAHAVCSELRKLNYVAKAVQRTLVKDEKSVEFRIAWKPKAGG
jgi:hypothetical protein